MNFYILVGVLLALVVVTVLITKQSFNRTLSGGVITEDQPKSFSPLGTDVPSGSQLKPPDVKEEIGLAMVYPQGQGASMDKKDSNAFAKNNKDVLLTDYSIPEAYGESSLTDPTGELGAGEGARVIKLNDTGNQSRFKPLDESRHSVYAAAYADSGEVQNGEVFLNESDNMDYSDPFVPESF